MRRAFITACVAVILLSQYLPGCEKQSVHLRANAMSRRVVKRAPMMLQGQHVRIGGNVELLVVVGSDGKPSCVSAVRGHPMLIAAAIDSVKHWRFRPYRKNRMLVNYSGALVLDAKEFVRPD